MDVNIGLFFHDEDINLPFFYVLSTFSPLYLYISHLPLPWKLLHILASNHTKQTIATFCSLDNVIIWAFKTLFGNMNMKINDDGKLHSYFGFVRCMVWNNCNMKLILLTENTWHFLYQCHSMLYDLLHFVFFTTNQFVISWRCLIEYSKYR